jgi:hypothetical protein
MLPPRSPVATGASRNGFSFRDLVNRVGPPHRHSKGSNLDGLGASPPALGRTTVEKTRANKAASTASSKANKLQAAATGGESPQPFSEARIAFGGQLPQCGVIA